MVLLRALLIGLLALPAWSAEVPEQQEPPIMDCKRKGSMIPICGLQAPEDLEVLPGGRFILLSQYGGVNALPGSLASFDTEKIRIRTLYPLPGKRQSSKDWGAKDCPGEPGAKLSPHGIHVSKRRDGQWQVLVVNHGGRESVEFFRLTKDRGGNFGLQWRGCVVLPEPAFLNDVVGLPEGGFLVTHMFAKDSKRALMASLAGRGSGHVWQWSPRNGLSTLPGGNGSYPSGIQISGDGRYVFLNFTVPGSVRKIDRKLGRSVSEVPMRRPDNSNWLPDGRLLIASHIGVADDPLRCSSVKKGACDLRFQLRVLNPDNMQSFILVDHEGAPMGAATSGVRVGDFLYLGSYSGNRMLRLPYPDVED